MQEDTVIFQVWSLKKKRSETIQKDLFSAIYTTIKLICGVTF